MEDGSTNNTNSSQNHGAHSHKDGLPLTGWFKILSVVILCGVGAIIAVVIIYGAVGHFQGESSYIDKSSYQAVEINTGGLANEQTYFGHITSLTTRYVALDDVFYLQPGGKANQYILNSLNCQAYGPTSRVIINRDQVVYWTNVSNSSPVAQQISKWGSTTNPKCTPSVPTVTIGGAINPITNL